MKNSNLLTIATRKSPLALRQANWVKTQLEAIYPELSIVLLGLTTSADRILTVPLYEVGGKGLFVKELEEALLSGRADLAVHSMKDVPMLLPKELCLAAICEREDPRDAWIANDYAGLYELPANAVIGTSSLRRQSQLLAYRQDIQIAPLRGNIDTRLEYLDKGDFAAIILAVAGLKRLGKQQRIRSILPVAEYLPAAGQGALGLECRLDDAATQSLVAALNHLPTYTCVTAERGMCTLLGGGCKLPVAAYAEITEEKLHLRGCVAKADGSLMLRAEAIGDTNHPELLGQQVAKELLRQGAGRIINQIS